MKNNFLSQRLKRAYLELEGINYNILHYQQHLNRYLKMIDSVLPRFSTAKILDIGGGFCYLTKFFKLQGFEIFAIDFFYGDIPQIRCERNGIPFFCLNVEVDDLPFEKEFFDVIILGEVLEHFTYSPLIPLKKIRNILKKDGMLLLTTPNVFRLIDLLKIFSGYHFFSHLLSSYQEEPIWYKGKKFYYRHNKLYTMKELRRLILQSGFRITSSGFLNEGISMRDNLIKIFLQCIFSPLPFIFPQLRDVLWVVAEKE